MIPPAVLGLDTSGTWCSVALVQGAETFARRAEVGAAHSAHLLPMVEAVLGDAGMALSRCDAIAFGAGPGSFTGLRVACAAAQGLGFGASLPVVPVGTLEAIAHSVRAIAPVEPFLVAQDARMGEVYWAVCAIVDADVSTIEAPAVSRPNNVVGRDARASGSPPYALGVGNAWSVHGAALDGLVERVVFRASADAVDVAELGRSAFVAGRAIAPRFAAPRYVRDDVARTTAERDEAAALRRRAA